MEFPERINFRRDKPERAQGNNFGRLEHDDIEYIRSDVIAKMIQKAFQDSLVSDVINKL